MSAIIRHGASSDSQHGRAPGGFVTRQGVDDIGNGLAGPDQGNAAAGDDAFFDGCPSSRHRVLDAVLLLLELHLGGGADLDDGDTAGQLGEPLLQLLAVPVAVGVLDLGLDLVDAAGDVVGGSRRRRRSWCCPW